MITSKSCSKLIALVLSAAMILMGTPVTAAGAETCAHAHDEACGYAEAAPCGHAHDENCGGLPGEPENRTADAEPQDGPEGEPGSSAGTVVAEFEAPPAEKTVKVGKAEDGDPAVITAFAPFDEDVALQGFDAGEIASQEEIGLPGTLEATGEDDAGLTIEGVTWECTAVPGDAEAPVAFDPDVPNIYEFTAVLPQGFAPADDVGLPVITVVIRGGEAAPYAYTGRVNITGRTVAEAQAAIQEEIDAAVAGGEGEVTVGGIITGAADTLALDIGFGVTVVWVAYLYGKADGPSTLVTIKGRGAFEVAGGLISNNGSAIVSTGGSAEVKVSGGTVSTQAGTAIQTNGRTVTVSSGTVSATTGTAIKATGTTTIIGISGTAKVEATGDDGVAISTAYFNATVTVNGGTVSATTGYAINIAGPDSSFTMSDGIIKAANDKGRAIYVRGDVEISDGTVSTTTGNTIEASGDVKISGGTVSTSTGSAIRTTGSIEISGTAVVEATGDTGRAINAATGSSKVTVSGGTVQATGAKGDAIYAYCNVEISGIGKVTGGHRAIFCSGSNVTVSGGTVSSTSNPAIYVTGNSCSVTVNDGTVSSEDDRAIQMNGAGNMVEVKGGLVRSNYSQAISTVYLKISGGLVFAYGSSASNIVSPNSTPTGTGMLLAWNKSAGNTQYGAGTSKDLSQLPTGASAYWAVETGQSGIAYANGDNAGFLPIDDVTVARIALALSDFTYTDLADLSRAYDGQATPVTASCTASEFDTTTGGAITITYTGTGDTNYPESITAPKNAGTYAVTLKTAGGTSYTPCEFALGSFTITPKATTLTVEAIPGQTYTGSQLTPAVTVKDGGTTLTLTTDYTVSYGANTDAGTTAGSVTITGAGNYAGSTGSASFAISPATFDGTTPTVQRNVQNGGVRTIVIPLAELDPEPNAGKSLGAISGYALSGYSPGDISESAVIDSGNLTITSKNSSVGTNTSETISVVVGTQNYGDITVSVALQTVDKTDVSDKISFAPGSAVYNGSQLTHETATISGITAGANPGWVYTYTAVDGGANLGADGKPLTAGDYTVTATYEDDDNKGSATVNFTVNKATPAYTVPTGLTATYGDTLADVSLLSYSGFSWNAPATSVGNAGSRDFPATYTPTDADNYKTVNVQITITVNKADPSITWPQTAAITYGQTLADAVFAGESGDGTFAYTKGTLTPAVAQSGTAYQVTFTPADTANYNTLTKDIPVTVNKALAPAIPAQTVSIYYAEPSTGNTVDLAALLPETERAAASYSVTSTNTLVTGASVSDGTLTFGTLAASIGASEDITVDVTMANYETAAITVTVSFTDKKVPVVVPSVTGGISYGQPLSALTLTATATEDGGAAVPGSIAWDDPSFKPAVGAPAQGWTFTPDDTDQYKIVTGSSAITVNKTTPAGTPAFTAITQPGKTLADANLTGSFTNPYDGNSVVAGTLIWNDGDATAVTANTAYGWTFTPDDTANYNIRTGSFTPYQSGGGSGGRSGSDTTAVTGLPKDYTLLIGQSVSWTPAPAGGTWSYDKDLLSMTQEGNTYTFTALKTGKATATYTVNGVTHTISITINASAISQTGDTANPLPWLLLMLAALAGCASLRLYRNRRNTK